MITYYFIEYQITGHYCLIIRVASWCDKDEERKKSRIQIDQYW